MFPFTISFVGLLLLLIFPASESVVGPHIADLNVLLPPRLTNPVEYRLQGSDGCFSWSWDHHDVLSVQPEYNGSSHCSTSARLISIAPYTGRKETAVYAADIHTGTVIRCEVFIDKIFRIQIFHHSVKLDLDGLATLRVRAFDDEENVFSSLVGLQFMWQHIPKTFEVDRVPHHLVHVPLKDTPLSDCGGFCGDLITQIKLEDSGVGSDLYVVRGTEIGHEIVSVHLLEPQLQHVADKIVLTVAEAMSLDPPSPIFVIAGASVRYRLRVIRQNIPQAIVLPSPYHRWAVTNSSVAQVDSMMGLVHAVNLGITNVIVEDTRVSGHQQISSMHVVLPDKLCLYIVPVTISSDPLEGTKDTPSTVLWYVVVGQQYVIHMKVFSGAQEIYITETDDVKLLYNNSAYWDTVPVPDDTAVKHGWRGASFLKPTTPGLGSLAASLTYHSGNPEMSEVLKIVQEVMICEKVKVSLGKTNDYSQTIYLPWVPGVHQEAELTATGGCAKTSKDYNWFSSDPATVSVSANGLIRAKKLGEAIMKVVSVFDSNNYEEVVVEVSVPSSMVMLQNFPVEVVVGTHLQASVTMKTANGYYFHRCDAFSSFVKWKLFSGIEAFKFVNTTRAGWGLDVPPQIENSESLHRPPCAWTHLYALGSGRAMLHATLSNEFQPSHHFSEVPTILKATLSIAAYPPLVVYQAGNGNQFGGYWNNLASTQAGVQDSFLADLNELYLVLGTSLDVILFGGPEPWGQGVKFIETIQILAEERKPLEDGILVKQASASGGRLYKILCQTFGNFKLVFSRGNLVGDDHPLPAIESVELSLICSFPSAITLIANEPANTLDVIRLATQADRGPGNVCIPPITVANGCTIRVAAVGIHNSGKPFANSSSLCLRWELSGCKGLAYWNDTDSLERSGATWEGFLVLQNASGLCVVRSTIVGFSDTLSSHLFEKALLLLKSSENVITDALQLQLVSSLRIMPESFLLFYDPDAKVNLSITGGTCFLDAVVNDTRVVEVIQSPPSMQCLYLMLGARGLGTALVTVHDIGITPPVAASALVKVSEIDWIKIISLEEISLMEGTTKSIDIVAGIHDGSAFDSSQYVYMNIHVHLEDGVLELVDKDGFSRPGGREIHGPNIVLCGKNLGITNIYVSARQRSGHEIFSQLIKVEVYAPLKIHPEDIFLVPGASYMLTVKGGPTLGVFTDYASMNDTIATIHRTTGMLSAISEGNTTVHALVYGNGGVVICEAYGRIKVGIPSQMFLNLQSEQLGVGRKMPIFPSFAEGDLFSFYELCKNYKWTIENEQVLGFKTASSLHSDKHEVPFAAVKDAMFPDFSDDDDFGFINVLYGRSAGRTNVAVSFSCDFASSGTFSHSISYSASASLLVVADPPLALGVPITWILPPSYASSNLLPASSESYSHWDSHSHKGSVIYSVLKTCGGKDGVIQYDAISIDGGRIKTKESNNIGCIQAKDRTTRNIVIASCVRVAEVAQVRVTTKEFPFHVADLAVGARLELVINYHDALGNPFYEAYGAVPFDVETNYPDIVSIEIPKGGNNTDIGNGNFCLQAMRHGRALVRVSINNNPQKADYILVSVGARINPQNPVLHIGRYLNFSVIGDGMNDLALGRWLTANESVISIDQLSGEAHAISKGSTQVLFEGSSLKLKTTVTVLRMTMLMVDGPAETLTNVPSPAMGYNFSVRFSDSNEKFEVAGNRRGVLYDCKVDPAYVGYAKPWRDLDTGNSYCLFFPFAPEHLVRSIPKLKGLSPELDGSFPEGPVFVYVVASLRDEPHVMGSARAIFVGGFTILEKGKLNMTPNANKSLITLIGNTDVEIHWNDNDHMLVSTLRRDNFGIGGRAEYEVKILRDESFSDKIIMVHRTTGQRSEVDVSYEAGERTPMAATSSNAIWVVVLVCAVVLILTVIIFKRLLDRPNGSRHSVPATPTSVGTVTPQRSPGSNTPHTPRTPQPFVDYVRRTIDETPYYRREGRRRFDPQNTY